MNKNTLIIGRAIFVIIIIVLFEIIIINEKGGKIFLPKATKKINTYIEKEFKNIKNEINTNNISYNNKEYKMKITSKDNNNLYFYVTYKNKNIDDTYEKDYKEGKSLLNFLNNDLEEKIFEKTNQKCKVSPLTTLDKYTDQVREKIIKGDNLLSLKYYYIEKEIPINNWNENSIYEEINSFIKNNSKNNITPKYYKITISDNKDVTKAIEITNITEDFINNKDNILIISDIINNKNSNILKENKIEYKFLNEED